jgi:hypothetical protein
MVEEGHACSFVSDVLNEVSVGEIIRLWLLTGRPVVLLLLQKLLGLRDLCFL